MTRDFDSVLAFIKTQDRASSTNLHRLVEPMAFLYYLGFRLVTIHEFAAQQGYTGSYSAFCRWVKRNVNFDEVCKQHEAEFTDLDPRRGVKGSPVLGRKKSDVSVPMKEAESKLSPRDALSKWQVPSYDDQLERLGLGKVC